MSGSKGQEIVYTWARLNTPTHKELSDTIDAALRRAKAEVWRDMQYWVRNETIDAMRKYIDARIAELEADARAAQIEEGVKNVENGRADQS